MQGIGLVCTHIADAIDGKVKVGFFKSEANNLARPDAWCAVCEEALIKIGGESFEKWFLDADFKILCSECWDEADAVCSDS